ncbi:hypothetical protein HDU87_005789 [Geranomyces variabilis]|uniref:DOMON domain-containing protein n=1 Tax=Geranomyces variabilis TaxID=109894 RepID=A0AAD5TGC7_9FUNG|nr:hypothetical protein HDU87_005789 [Geranomyces variabilis]
MRTLRIAGPLAALVLCAAQATNAASCYQTLNQTAFPNCQMLDPRYALHWNVHGDQITYGVTVDVDVAANWVGFGVSDNGGMRGADITLLTADAGGKVVAQDYWAEMLDTHQDVTLDASQSTHTAGQTTAVFTRPLNSCDPQDQPILANTTHSVIWAIGSSPTLSYHNQNRGDSKITFIPDPSLKAVVDPPDLALLQMFFQNYSVPNNQTTTYTCAHKAFAPPAPVVAGGNGTKFHITRFEGVALSKHVHHMIVYGCDQPPKTFNQSYDCLSMDVSCTDVLLVWAPGVGAVDLPPEAGFAIGTAADAYQYFSLQIHYTNQELETIVDSSGFNVWYTSHLRTYDMGVLFLGTEAITIPPNMASFTVPSGYCPSDCTQKLPHPIIIQNNFFHAHTLGQNLTTQHIRNGVELQPLGTRAYYDFNHQGASRPYGGPREVRPGDALVTTCSYSSLGRASVTSWSEDTSGEMCYNIVQYYPRVSMNWCTTTDHDLVSCNNNADLQTEIGRLLAQNINQQQLEQTLVKEGFLSESKVSDLNYTRYKDQCGWTQPGPQPAANGGGRRAVAGGASSGAAAAFLLASGILSYAL